MRWDAAAVSFLCRVSRIEDLCFCASFLLFVLPVILCHVLFACERLSVSLSLSLPLSISPHHWSQSDDADVGGQISLQPLTLTSHSLPPNSVCACVCFCLSLSAGSSLMGFFRKRALMELWPSLYWDCKALYTYVVFLGAYWHIYDLALTLTLKTKED